MAKEICISSTPHETRLAILEDDQLAEVYYERENEYTLAGSIYKGRVTRVLPGMQSAFVDIGLERDAFLYVTDFLEEQEDSADFERVPAGDQQPRQESAQPRENQPRPVRTEGRARQQAESAPTATDAVGSAPEDEGSEESDSPSGTKRWRGRRGRRRGFRGRGPQGQVEENRELESPEAVEESISAEPVALPERGSPGGIPAQHLPHPPQVPIVLPGESLSKYGAAPSAQKTTPSEQAAKPVVTGINYIAPKPSTLVEVPSGWDGGAQLPGETLSRHRKSETTVAEVAPAATPVAAEEPAPVEAPAHHIEVGAVEEVEAVEELGTVEVEKAAEQTEHHEHAAYKEPVAHAERVFAEPAPIEETHAAVEASEETSATAAAPFEEQHAVPQVVTEPAPLVLEEQEASDDAQEEVHEFEPENASASHRVDPVAPSEFRLSELFRFRKVEEEPQAVSEPAAPVEAPQAQTPVAEDTSADAASTLPLVGENGHHPESSEAEAANHIYGFAPGTGLIEEEVIEEEEYDFEPVGAHADEHDSEDLEEETLDNSGTIGDVVRDAHIDQRVGFGGDQETEDDEQEQTDEFENGFVEIEEDEEDELEPGDAAEGEAHGAEVAAPQREGEQRSDRRGGRGGRGRQQQGRRRQGGGGGRRPSAQTMDLPIISELLKQGQEILVQIAKEPIAKKGARITSHIALPGRFLVFMPTVNHVGVSRKISSDEERHRLKRILISEKGTNAGGFIVRTAADGASEEELRADIRFLISLWTEIRQRSDDGKAPALIYHDLNLVERVLREQVSDNFSTIWVDSETEYERIVRFLNRFQPSLVRRVKLYTKETPLFEHFGIQEEISKALKSKVWLKSGGSIVINQTEALVAIDINTGKYVGKTARLEDTILKTNLDAIPEIVRQIRLRDLGGIIVIDFIDMDERKNRHKVMQALEDELKHDRAPSKVLQFNDFGLVAITRKRVKQSLERTLSTPCTVCTGTGMVKSPITVANEIYVEMRKMIRHLDRNDVMLRVNPEVVKTLKSGNGRWLNELEEMIGKTIIVKSDPTLHPEQFDIH
jgi:ribonuclease E